MNLYIRSASAISPQQGFDKSIFPDEIRIPESNRLNAIEPEYREWIDPKLIRRMSRIIRMGVAAGRKCLHEAAVQMPDAIITGTAYGCLEDTGIFLGRMVAQGEEMLSPTAFIQSTHNTVAAQIALLLHCNNYNNSFVHRAFSFENALLDAELQLEENPDAQILVGSADEITNYSHSILSRFGLYRKSDQDSNGTIDGEGAAFFLLSGAVSGKNIAAIESFRTLYKPESQQEVDEFIVDFLAAAGISLTEVDLLITGKNGDSTGDAIYDNGIKSILNSIPAISYKNLCGEYPTAISFALWFAVNILREGKIPAAVSTDQSDKIKRILIWNHHQGTHHTLMLISAC